MGKWQRFRYNPVLPMGEDGKLVTGSKSQTELSRRVASEGMVLLKNDGALPLFKGARVALFGKASVDYVKGGGGSGDTTVAYVNNIYRAMLEKQKEGKVVVDVPLGEFYARDVSVQYAEGKNPGQTEEPEIPDDVFLVAESCDVAIISICRYSFEDGDLKGDGSDGGYFLTRKEKTMIDRVCDAFDKVVVVLNVGAITDVSWFKSNDKISAVLLAWQGGMEGATAEADILCGDVNPSGKLSDTIAYSLKDYPSYDSFFESDDFVNYTEDVFVGYRYFETVKGAKDKVAYPFGFGLSYTRFKISCEKAEKVGNKIILTVKVCNEGNREGKEVVQVYTRCDTSFYDVPNRELRAFMKTKSLMPSESQVLRLEFCEDDLTVFDEEIPAYVIPDGNVSVFVGSDVRSAEKVFAFDTKRKIVKKVGHCTVTKRLPRKLKSDGTYEFFDVSDYEAQADLSKYAKGDSWNAEYVLPAFRDCKNDERRINAEDVVSGKNTLDEFVDSLSTDELITLVGGTHNRGVADTRGFGGLDYLGIPAVMTADGPAGLRIRKDRGVNTTAWPIATAICCSFNEELAFKVGKQGATEVEENNIGVWLTPAINIHRNPLCGRNFEYYSEDPYLTGKMASAMVKGIQTQNVSACVKHFCCNNKETNRYNSDSVVSERALREIYLKAFEMVIKEGAVRAVMTSYNKVNGKYPSETKELLQGFLREETGFTGLIMTDWGNLAEHYREVLAGNNVKMPFGTPVRLKQQFEDGLISKEDLKRNVKYLLEFLFAFN